MIRYISVLLTLAMCVACGNKDKTDGPTKADKEKTALIKGTWVNDEDGMVSFSMSEDSVFYGDPTSMPEPYVIRRDTLYVGDGDMPVVYVVRKLTAESLVLADLNGEEMVLTKSHDKVETPQRDVATLTNQRKVVKRDTVVTVGESKMHAYMQVNPTTYKVAHKALNNDGLTVENVYYDNIIYMGVYKGSVKVFGRNFAKKDFARMVPEAYLEQSVLDDVTVAGAKDGKLQFVVTLTVPDSYTSYRVNVMVDDKGGMSMSL